MEYEDRLSIDTPEGVALELTLAGLGSRFVAALLDGLVKLVLLAAVALAVGLGTSILSGGGGALGIAVFLLALFAVTFLYDVLFEVLASGRTPGKRATGLRVVLEGGGPITLVPSAVRNALRLLDGPATSYVAGVVAILATRRNQRLGDLAAGTVVIRERTGADASARAPAATAAHAHEHESTAPWDLTGVSSAELAAVRRFLERRGEIDAAARARLAAQLADGLRPKVPGAGNEPLAPEPFLERLAAATRRG